MAQQHLERLSAIDASFLANETESTHMHVGAVVILEGPPPPFEEFLDGLRTRLHLVPRYRQKLAHAQLDTSRPLWVDDPSFNLEYHVRQTALPRPGSERQLMRLAARIMSQQLDRSKPLWEVWLVEGLEGGGVALISKTHHALIDGVAGVDLAQVMFDLAPVPPELDEVAEGLEPWTPQPEPTAPELVAGEMTGLAKTGLGLASRALGALTSPQRALSQAREGVEGLGEVVWAGLNPAPDTPLNVEIGPHRRFVGVRCRLADAQLVKRAFGGTVNDVVLAVVSGALRDWLGSRGVRTEGLEMRALVPVSIRAEHERGELGNKIAAMRGPLPVYVEDPLQRLETVKKGMGALKESKQAVGAEVLAGVQSFAPPTILAQAARINFSTRLFNLIVTNVPGPQFPLYVRGREMQDVFPVAFLPRNHALAVAIMSYNGGLNFGLLGDYDVLPDIDRIGEAITAAMAELVDLARDATPAGDGSRPSAGARAAVPSAS